MFTLVACPSSVEEAARITCMLGSFDPVHHAHVFMMQRALEDCDALVLLVPEQHFEKRIAPGRNAQLPLRVALLGGLAPALTERAAIGWTDVVLLIDLEQVLRARFPAASIRFAMGDDTLAKVLRTRDYFAAVGRPFGAQEQRRVDALTANALVFARRQPAAGRVSLPPVIAELSSTRVRLLATALRASRVSLDVWRHALAPLVPPSVADSLWGCSPYRDVGALPPGMELRDMLPPL